MNAQPEQTHVRRVWAVADIAGVGDDPASLLHARGITSVTIQPGRSFMLQDRRGIAAAIAGPIGLDDWRVTIVSVLCTEQLALRVAGIMCEAFRFGREGRGTVYIEEADVLGRSDWAGLTTELPAGLDTLFRVQRDLAGICCIVQRGQGDFIARAALAEAACVPHVTFGAGAGLRDKLGLLRITIPPEKELVYMVVPVAETYQVMAMLIARGQLDLPGRGFIYAYPIESGVIDKRVRERDTGHAASMDQVVAAVDDLTGGTRWRRNARAVSPQMYDGYLKEMVELSVQCDEGASEGLVAAAMGAGAGGATLCEATSSIAGDGENGSVSPARELCGLVVPRSVIGPVMEALDVAGLYGPESHGVVLARTVPRAFSYRAPTAERQE